MKIVKRFSDYYDSAIGYDHDDSLVYDRKSECLSVENEDLAGAGNILQALAEMPWYDDYLSPVEACLLAFCGRIYPYWHRMGSLCGYVHGASPRLFTAEGLAKDLQEVRDQVDPWDDLAYAFLQSGKRERSGFSKERVDRFANEFTGKPVDVGVFHILTCPSFLIEQDYFRGSVSGYQIVKNPRLAGLNFGQHYDAFSCYQELSMFLGGVLTWVDAGPRTVGDDRTVARSKGFDDQSFRTRADGQKAARRHENRRRKKGL